MRSYACGELRAGDAGTTVRLAGWVARRRDHGGVVFIDLRDASGLVQVVFREGAVAAAAHELRGEYCILVTGKVASRPAGNENAELPTGEVEVVADGLEVLARADPVPFAVDAGGSEPVEVGEDARLRWRYLDLRRPGPARALRIRADATRAMRQVMDEHRFVEVDTPYLTRSTPEGARDFLVPARLQPGRWYALPQSPQLFKQLLMVAGVERYYQIARCFRDEDFRADRQPEFTQLDVELSFLDEEDVYALSEEVLARVWREVLGVEVATPFRRMGYAEATARFGTDKPDLRYELELADLSGFFAGSGVGVLRAALDEGGHVGAVVMPGGAGLTRRQLDERVEWARGRGARGLAWVIVEPDGTLRSPLAKFLSPEETAGFATAAGARPGDTVFLGAGPRARTLELLGALRVAIAVERGLVPQGRFEFLWVTDMPMFEPTGDGGWTAVHHPFTAPTVDWEEKFQQAPGDALARAYDVVCNGYEIASGSIRIHRRDLQNRVFEVIGLPAAEAEAKFGFLLEAFRYGPPPHGGIAFGLDRICALLAGADSIREVIAFPKTSSGGDPLTGAPTPITPEQRREAGIDARPGEGAPAAP
ncbi:MAG TPA: aspartate--tRNA ligase [Actinomycetes bacterium]|nr:aspartate--tRNA ligase [Actinomycetes bacterium]